MTRLRLRHHKADGAHPEASVLMPLYNSQGMVAEAIGSVLRQQGCVLDVLISDDNSDDATFEEARACIEAFSGPHHVRLFKTERRLGIDHLHQLIDQAVCRLLIEAHGDDVSLPGRMVRVLDIHRQTSASLIVSHVFRRQGTTDLVTYEPVRQGLQTGWLTPEQCLPPSGNGVLVGARYAFDRAVHDVFPRLDSAFAPSSHDRIQALRASMLGGVWFTDEPLLQYRIHDGQGSTALADVRSNASSSFGWSLRHLSAIRAMQKDVGHAVVHGIIDAGRATRLGERLDECSRHFLKALLDSRDDLVRTGLQALWVPESALRQANVDHQRRSRGPEPGPR